MLASLDEVKLRFALNLVGYIVASTHLDNAEYIEDTKEWERGIAHFCDNAIYQWQNEAFVKFKAILKDMQFVKKVDF